MLELDQKLSDALVKELYRIFNDDNLKNEPFLMRQIQSNPGGWISLKVLLNRNKFNSLRSITKDTKTIASAVENVPNGLVQVSADHQKIRRNPDKPLPVSDKRNRV
jgi:hypothetical protein